jgi:hypothetical protein
MSELMSEPKGKQLRVETEALRVGIRDRGEMLQTRECHALAIDHELAGVGRANTNHEHHVDIDVLLQEPSAPLFRGPSERDDVGSLEHLLQVGTICQRRRADYVDEVRTIRIDDVILPIGLEDTAMGFEVALVGGDAISAIQYGEEIWQQVDQHSTRKRAAGEQRGAHQRWERRTAGALDAV